MQLKGGGVVLTSFYSHTFIRFICWRLHSWRKCRICSTGCTGHVATTDASRNASQPTGNRQLVTAGLMSIAFMGFSGMVK